MTVQDLRTSAQGSPLPFTIITATRPDRLTKRFDLEPDGTLRKSPGGNLIEGTYRRAAAMGLEDLARQLEALGPNQAVTWGLPPAESGTIVAREILHAHPGAIARKRENFAFAAGPGVMMLDHDGVAPGQPPLTVETLLATLYGACQILAAAPMLIRPSSSAGILGPDGRELAPFGKWRVYVPVTRAADIPNAGAKLVTLLQAQGHAWTLITTSGHMLNRCPVDAEVWQPERLDFAALADLGPGLHRAPCPPQIIGDPMALFDLAMITLDSQQQTRAVLSVTQARARDDATAQAARAQFVADRAARIAEKTGRDRTVTRESLSRCLEAGELPHDFPLRLDDGTEITVDQLLQDEARDSRRMCDPIEPDRDDGDTRIALYVTRFGAPCIYSHAHGGQSWRLIADPARVFAGAEVSGPRPESQPLPAAAPAGPAMTKRDGETFVHPAQLPEFFRGCVYVSERHSVLTPGGILRKPEVFNALYGGHTFVMDNRNEKTTRKAFEAFTENQVFRPPTADGTCFKPLLQPGAIVETEGRTRVNVWWPATIDNRPGEIAPFFDHLARILPDEEDRRILVYYMANLVQHAGHKFQWAVILQGTEGNGKTFASRCIAHALGRNYVVWPNAAKLGNQFNAWLFGKLAYLVEDFKVDADGRLLEQLKPLITGKTSRSRRRASTRGPTRCAGTGCSTRTTGAPCRSHGTTAGTRSCGAPSRRPRTSRATG